MSRCPRATVPTTGPRGTSSARPPRTTIPTTTITPSHAAAVWTGALGDDGYVDGRFALSTSAPAFVYLVVTDGTDPNDAVNLSRTAATGDIHPPGDPPPPFGREAGVYAADTWLGAWTVDVPGAGHYLGYAVNTATGAGFPQVQAFPPLTRFDDSSAESVGMYGNTYDLAITLAPGADHAANVEVWLATYGGGTPNFWFNGPAEVDGAVLPVWLAPDQRVQRLATVPVGDSPSTVHVRLPIPGLSSIPLGLFLVTTG
jgi:hypothetical protein